MITAQDIREKTFEKARIGGYDMASVDDFLEELADEITAAQKENAVLKSKMKVLVDKIEEYRANEEALNMAVISAQKLAVQIENDARSRANNMLADAERQVNAKVGSITELANKEEMRLATAKAENAKYFDSLKKLFNAQLARMESIRTDYAAAPAAPSKENADISIEDVVRSIERSVTGLQPEEDVRIDVSAPASSKNGSSTKNFGNTQAFSL